MSKLCFSEGGLKGRRQALGMIPPPAYSPSANNKTDGKAALGRRQVVG